MAEPRKRPPKTFVEPWGPLCNACGGRLTFCTNNGVLVELCDVCGARAHPIRYPSVVEPEPAAFAPFARDNSERNAIIAIMRADGIHVDVIAERFGITRDRVYMVLRELSTDHDG